MNERVHCHECQFAQRQQQRVPGGGAQERFECHFNPPMPLMQPVQDAAGLSGFAIKAEFPVMLAHGWCAQGKKILVALATQMPPERNGKSEGGIIV